MKIRLLIILAFTFLKIISCKPEENAIPVQDDTVTPSDLPDFNFFLPCKLLDFSDKNMGRSEHYMYAWYKKRYKYDSSGMITEIRKYKLDWNGFETHLATISLEYNTEGLLTKLTDNKKTVVLLYDQKRITTIKYFTDSVSTTTLFFDYPSETYFDVVDSSNQEKTRYHWSEGNLINVEHSDSSKWDIKYTPSEYQGYLNWKRTQLELLLVEPFNYRVAEILNSNSRDCPNDPPSCKTRHNFHKLLESQYIYYNQRNADLDLTWDCN